MGSAVAVAISLVVACGARTGLSSGTSASDASVDSGELPVELCDQDGGTQARDAADACSGAGCDCDTGTTTTLRGVVHDPAGTRPIYGAIVYVPDGPLEPIPSGARCAPCGAAVSGHPRALTTTDVEGRFRLDGVPAGSSVPLVVQLGKWRRETHVSIAACADNVADPEQTRFPRNRSEGSIPKIALTSGCDKLECFLSARIGLDATELTAPGGGGSVEWYAGEGYSAPAPKVPATALFSDRARLRSYDIVLAACECSVHGRTPEEYDNIHDYLDHGGRLFAGHYHYNLFASSAQCFPQRGPCAAAPDFASVAEWAQPRGGPPDTEFIDRSHPRGAALAEHLAALGLASDGNVSLWDLRADVGQVSPDATRWIYGLAPSGYDTYYLSFNTPVGSKTPCGRAVFSDIHSAEHASSKRPIGVCGDAVNEAVLEFLFFDMNSCVQDDRAPPVRPCTK